MIEIRGITTEPFNPDAEEHFKTINKIKGEEEMDEVRDKIATMLQMMKMKKALDEIKKIIEQTKDKKVKNLKLTIIFEEGEEENV